MKICFVFYYGSLKRPTWFFARLSLICYWLLRSYIYFKSFQTRGPYASHIDSSRKKSKKADSFSCVFRVVSTPFNVGILFRYEPWSQSQRIIVAYFEKVLMLAGKEEVSIFGLWYSFLTQLRKANTQFLATGNKCLA